VDRAALASALPGSESSPCLMEQGGAFREEWGHSGPRSLPRRGARYRERPADYALWLDGLLPNLDAIDAMG